MVCDALRDSVPFAQKSTHGRVLLLVKLQAKVCNFTKSNILPWVFFMLFKLCKWCQIAESISYTLKRGPLRASGAPNELSKL